MKKVVMVMMILAMVVSSSFASTIGWGQIKSIEVWPSYTNGVVIEHTRNDTVSRCYLARSHTFYKEIYATLLAAKLNANEVLLHLDVNKLFDNMYPTITGYKIR